MATTIYLSIVPSISLSSVVGGGAFQPYLPDKDSPQGCLSSGRGGGGPGLHVAQEALLTPVCDLGYTHMTRYMSILTSFAF